MPEPHQEGATGVILGIGAFKKPGYYRPYVRICTVHGDQYIKLASQPLTPENLR